mgnify:CR=1 FL=1
MEQLLAHCGGLFSQHGNLWLVFFLGGLTGSITHCLVMCGPLVACQSACSRSCGGSMKVGTQWHYHAGRLFTYGLLGFFCAYLGKYLAAYSFWPTLSAMMLTTAGLLFIVSAIRPDAHRIALGKIANPLLRGMLMGFMPCGLLYAALMMASTLTNPWAGLVAMWLFTLGTMPVLVATSLGAHHLNRFWANAMDNVGRLVMAFSGASLITTAYKLMR